MSEVAPCAGAWIEIAPTLLLPLWPLSPPARGRGLKSCVMPCPCIPALSPPARGRGLKCWAAYTRFRRSNRVAPCAGAWIEMGVAGRYQRGAYRRPLRGGVD